MHIFNQYCNCTPCKLIHILYFQHLVYKTKILIISLPTSCFAWYLYIETFLWSFFTWTKQTLYERNRIKEGSFCDYLNIHHLIIRTFYEVRRGIICKFWPIKGLQWSPIAHSLSFYFFYLHVVFKSEWECITWFKPYAVLQTAQRGKLPVFSEYVLFFSDHWHLFCIFALFPQKCTSDKSSNCFTHKDVHTLK